MFTSPGSRTLAHALAKQPAQMCLVGEPAHNRDTAERVRSDAHEVACKLNPTLHEIGMRRETKRLLECTNEMRFAALYNIA